MTNQEYTQRIFCLMDILKEETDENHGITLKEIMEKMEDKGFHVTRQTIPKYLETLGDCGVEVDQEAKAHNTIYYSYSDRELSVSDVKILVDAVSSSQFITKNVSQDLINRLVAYTSKFQKKEITTHVQATERIRSTNRQSYSLLYSLIQAIDQNKKIRYKYIDYTPDKEKIEKNNGEIYEVSPYSLAWNDDRYYLIGYSEKHGRIITPRADRMKDLIVTEEECHPIPEGFDVSQYMNTVVHMYNGETQKVILECDNSKMFSLIDKFGESIETKRISEEKFQAEIEVSVSPTFFSWLFSFGKSMKIVGPEHVKEEYKKMALAILE
ncbi:helix-turn-helix transcriptional regulator [Streptococcus alactolyticus]|uniref:helix-turn-helix transcriptional regulator n=1 Tax=Streptococcus alactolyticus TaxID=29389 RepID=UPI003F9A8ABD